MGGKSPIKSTHLGWYILELFKSILYANPSKWKPFLLGEIKEATRKQASSEDSEVFVETSLDKNSLWINGKGII